MAGQTKKKVRRKLPKGAGEGKAARAERYERFCQEYAIDQNGARAARAAGYAEGSARDEAYKLLTKPDIQARVKQLIGERIARIQLSGDEILLEIKKLATSDVRRLFDVKTGCFLPMDQWPDDMAVCVASIEVEELFRGSGKNRVWVGYTKKMKLWDKPKSQENLGRNKGLFKDVVDNQGTVNIVAVDEKDVKDALDKIERDN